MVITKRWRAMGVLAIAVTLAACGAAGSSSTGSAEAASAPAADVPSAAPSETSATPHPLAGSDAWIAYQTARSGAEGVWLVRPDGSEDHEVALDVPGEHHHPDWSPDGTQLVVTSRTERDVLYVLDVETDAGSVLFECADDCVGDDEAAWSPDGTRVAFVRAMEPFIGDAPSCALFVGDVASGAVEQIGDTRSCYIRETFPHWSPDGSRLVYYRGVYQGAEIESTAVYAFDLESGVETKLTDDRLMAGDADWSRDGEWILFSTYPLRDFQCCEVSNLYRIRADGSGLEQITAHDTEDLRAAQPRYTPDGSSIVFTAVTPSDRVPWVIPADGGEPIAVAQSGIYTHPTWQPDR